ncbi:UNVERIFIED_CONTAM: hypothetical protein FKN15_033541 [Acipenser sinensis]
MSAQETSLRWWLQEQITVAEEKKSRAGVRSKADNQQRVAKSDYSTGGNASNGSSKDPVLMEPAAGRHPCAAGGSGKAAQLERGRESEPPYRSTEGCAQLILLNLPPRVYNFASQLE